MKFKIFGDDDAPDWFIAEIFTVSNLSSVRVRLLCSHLVAVRASAASNVQPFGTEKPTADDDATTPTQTPRVEIDYDKLRKLVDDTNTAEDVEAVVATLEYAIANAARFDVDEATLGRELEQLGLPREHAEAITKSYGKNRDGLRRAALRSTVRVNGLRDLSWGITFGSGADDDANGELGDGVGVRLTLDTVDDGRVDVEMSEDKFRVLLSELKAVRSLMDDDVQ
jgi:hypothetical protein